MPQDGDGLTPQKEKRLLQLRDSTRDHHPIIAESDADGSNSLIQSNSNFPNAKDGPLNINSYYRNSLNGEGRRLSTTNPSSFKCNSSTQQGDDDDCTKEFIAKDPSMKEKLKASLNHSRSDSFANDEEDVSQKKEQKVQRHRDHENASTLQSLDGERLNELCPPSTSSEPSQSLLTPGSFFLKQESKCQSDEGVSEMSKDQTIHKDWTWDLESAIHFVISSRSRHINQEGEAPIATECEYLLLSSSSLSSRCSGDNGNKDLETINRAWITFRLGHAGDASELAHLYRSEKKQQHLKRHQPEQPKKKQQPQVSCAHTTDETTSLEVLLAEGMGDEDHPPVVYCLLAFLHEEIDGDTKPQTLNYSAGTTEDTASSELTTFAQSSPDEDCKHDVAGSNTRINSRLGAAVLLTEQLDFSFSHRPSKVWPGKLIRAEWLFVDKNFSLEIQQSIQSKIWLCISTIGLLLKCPVYVSGNSRRKRRADGGS